MGSDKKVLDDIARVAGGAVNIISGLQQQVRDDMRARVEDMAARLDLVPRGHPGDGRAEVQIYAVPGRERRALQSRLATGTHVPHPKITQRSGSRVDVSIDRKVPLELDGRPVDPIDDLAVDVVPNAYRLLL